MEKQVETTIILHGSIHPDSPFRFVFGHYFIIPYQNHTKPNEELHRSPWVSDYYRDSFLHSLLTRGK